MVFDPEHVRDAATFAKLQQAADGIDAVWVSWRIDVSRAGRDRRARDVSWRVLTTGWFEKGVRDEALWRGRWQGTGRRAYGWPFALAVEADGWLFVSSQTPMENGEVINGGIVEQSHKAIQNVLAILQEAGYGTEHVVRCGVWLDDPRDFASFNKVFKEYFGANPPAHACRVVDGDRLQGRWIAWLIRSRKRETALLVRSSAASRLIEGLYCRASRALSGIGKLKLVRNGLIFSPPRRV